MTQGEVPVTGWQWLWFFATRRHVLVCAALAFLMSSIVALYYWLPAGVNAGQVVSAAVVSANVFVAIFALGLGTWEGVRSHKLGLNAVEHPAVRVGELAPAVRIGALATTMAISSGAVFVLNGIAMLIAPHRDGTLSIELVLYGMGATAAMVPIGFLLGKSIPHYLAIPAVVITGWLLASFLDAMHPMGFFWLEFFVMATPFDTWNSATWFGSIAWLVGVGLLATALASFRRRSGRALALALCGILVAIGGGLTMVGNDFRINDRTTDLAQDGAAIVGASCEGTALEVCLPKSFEGVRESLTAAFSDLNDRLEHAPSDLQRLELRPRGVGQVPPDGTMRFSMDQARVDAVPSAVVEFVDDFSGLDRCYSDDGMEAWGFVMIVTEWLASTPLEPSADTSPSTDEARSRFAALSERERRIWLGSHWHEYTTCQLSFADFDDAPA